MKLLLAAIGLAVLVLCMVSPAVGQTGQNLVVNGSFEADPCTGSGAGYKLGLVGNAVTTWLLPASDGTYPWCLQNVNAFNAGPAASGNQWLVLGEVATGVPYTIQQTLTGLSPGSTYMLSFAIASESGCCSVAEVSFPSGSSTATQTFTAPASANYWKVWGTNTMNFIATSSSVTLQFKNLVSAQTGGLDLGLDNVSVAPAGQATNGGSPITLFDANTTCASCQAVQPVGLVPGVGAETPAPPAFFSGLPVTLGGITYGAASKFGGGNGGFTGWINVSYTVPAGTPTGNFILQFETSNAGDTSLASALAIDNIVSPGLTESFENGVPATWTLSGGAVGFPGATGGTSPSITNLAPTNGSFFAWITNGCSDTTACNNTLGSVPTTYGSLYQGPGTNGLPSGQGLASSVSGTTLQSPPFTLAAGNTISFDVNFGTNDGTYNFPDWAAGQLIPTLTGTPINATPMQSFIFNNVANNLDEYDFDYSNATGTITANANATPFISDFQIAPSDWANVVAGTPFATTACIPIAGANGNCAQKKHVCTTPTIATQAGANCPQSSLRNILLSSTFDPVTTITNPGTIFGVVESNDSGACPYDGPAANLSCPSNGLVSFTGTGSYSGGKGTGTTNSRTVLVTGVLPPATTTTGFVNAAGWTNTKNATPVTGTLTANPPQNPLTNGMVVAPIDSISYGISQGALPPTFPPISTDTTVFSPNPPGNASTCPTTITATTPAPPFAIPVNLGPLAEGTWLLHYQARDCGGTNELKFTRDSVSGNWSTNFQSLTINVDNKPPMISTNFSGPAPVVLNGPGPTLNFTCTDPPLSGGGAPSGIQVCGTSSTTNVPGPSIGLSTFSGSNGPLSTATIGTNHATVYTQDQAGNTASTIANYSVLYPSTGNCLGDPVHQILPPINPNGSSVFSKPTIIYANFRVCDANGKSIGTPGLITNITVRITKNDITDSDAAEDAAALLKATIFNFDTTHQYWLCKIGTSGLDSGYTYAFTLTLNDGSTLPFRFGVK